MSNDPPPRRDSGARTWLLSVIGVAAVGVVSGALLLWHAQVADVLGRGDKEPVVSTVSAPAIAAPPTAVMTPAPPRRTPRPSKTPTTPTPSSSPTRAPKKPVKTPTSREESIDALSPKLASRLKKAIAAARAAGVRISITSGRRSAAKQQRLLNEAIKKYGSYRLATRWVLPPKYSAHVQGKAVDIGPAAAMTWLDKNGWRYGVCRRYDNEPWHFEALVAPGRKCPPREAHAVARAD